MTHRDLAALGAFALGLALLAPATGRAHDDDAERAREARGGAAQAAVDAQGRVRAPSRAEAAELAETLRAQFEPAGKEAPVAVRLPGGALAVQLDERFESVAVATVEGGRVAGACATSAAEARQVLAPARPATAEEK